MIKNFHILYKELMEVGVQGEQLHSQYLAPWLIKTQILVKKIAFDTNLPIQCLEVATGPGIYQFL